MHKQDKVFIFCAQAVHHKEKIGKMNIGLMILVNFIRLNKFISIIKLKQIRHGN